MNILTINAGSSSVRFALFQTHPLKRILSDKIDRIKSGSFSANTFFKQLTKQIDFSQLKSVGHRVVFGMNRKEIEPVTTKLLQQLSRLRDFDPEHLPREIELMEALRRTHPKLKQFACFDTAFHQTMPRVACLLPIPRSYEKKGVRRYGFHGLSYAYLMGQLARIAGNKKARGRIILAHLGNGASLAAVRNGKSIDTSMGFTPSAGLPMSSRTGDLDPGVAWYLMRQGISSQRFNHLINRESGLLGVSQTSSDVRDLLKRESRDIRAREAIELFCYQAKKWIGAFAASLGGLDALIFSGGIGENSQEVRSRICKGLGFIGIELDNKRNRKSEEIISKKGSRVTVRVIRTDEEAYIAHLVLKETGGSR